MKAFASDTDWFMRFCEIIDIASFESLIYYFWQWFILVVCFLKGIDIFFGFYISHAYFRQILAYLDFIAILWNRRLIIDIFGFFKIWVARFRFLLKCKLFSHTLSHISRRQICIFVRHLLDKSHLFNDQIL